MLIGCDSGANWVAIGLAGLALVLFGIGYNAFVAWLERKRYDEGYTAFLVVGGVLVTLLGTALLSWQAAALTLLMFVCSGLPMVVGSVWRYGVARDLGRKLLAELYKQHDRKA